MREEGVLENPKVDRIFGIHVWPLLPTGTVGSREGTFLAAAGFLKITVHGKGGHPAIPQKILSSNCRPWYLGKAIHSILPLSVAPPFMADRPPTLFRRQLKCWELFVLCPCRVYNIFKNVFAKSSPILPMPIIVKPRLIFQATTIPQPSMIPGAGQWAKT